MMVGRGKFSRPTSDGTLLPSRVNASTPISARNGCLSLATYGGPQGVDACDFVIAGGGEQVAIRVESKVADRGRVDQALAFVTVPGINDADDGVLGGDGET